jgi:signal transduction histidine kinase/ActR/RegA family two-component response regulator
VTLLLDIAPYVTPVGPADTGAEIYRRFQDEPDTLAIAVVDADNRPLGLVERNKFLGKMAAQHGYALWAQRPITRLMTADALTVDGDVTVSEFCGAVLQDRPSDLLNGFIVTCGGRYAGVGAMLGLLQAAASAANAASLQAQEALAARSRFLAVMSHEIRTPLNGVLGVAEIIRRRATQPELHPLLDTIAESGGVLLRLLNDALDLSRAEASGLELDEAPLAVAPLIDDTLKLWGPQAELRGLGLAGRYDGPGDLWVLGDATRLRQVLNNLISNALKFTAQGGVEVALAVEDDGQCVWLRGTVADTGPGITADQMARIFEPFQQTEEGVRRGGAGLGLAVCRQLIECMGGTIGVRDNAGGGACFEIGVPLYKVEAPGPEALETCATEVLGTSERRVHILIADDNATNRLVAANLCDIFGCTTESVVNGAEAVAAAATGRFDLILMDIKMPLMDGVEATRTIRSRRDSASQIPIIALTANADAVDAVFYRRCGMNGVVQKPIDPALLGAAMTAVLALPDAAAEARVA